MIRGEFYGEASGSLRQQRISSNGWRGAVGVKSLAHDPSTGILYGVDNRSGELLSMDIGTGAPTTIAPVGALEIEGLAFDTNTGRLLGATAGPTSELVSIDPVTGDSTLIGQINAGSEILGLAYDSVGGVLYGADGTSGDLFTIDVGTGVGTLIGTSASPVTSLAFSTQQDILIGASISGDTLFTIDKSTAVSTSVGSLTIRGDAAGLAYDEVTDTAYVATIDTHQLLTADYRGSGAATVVGFLGFNDIAGTAYDSNQDVLYGADVQSRQLVSIDPVSGAATAIGDTLFDANRGMAFDPASNTLYATSSESQLISVNVATGAGTSIGSTSPYNGIGSLAFDTSSGLLYGFQANFGAFLSIDPDTAAVTEIGSSIIPSMEGMTYDSRTDTLYGSRRGDVYEVNRLDGSSTLVAPILAENVQALAFDPNSGTMFGSGFQTGALFSLSIDNAADEGSSRGHLGLANATGLASDPSTGVVYAVDSSEEVLVSIDRITGEATQIGVHGQNLQGLAFDTASSRLFGVTTSTLFEIGTSTGAATQMMALSGSPTGLAFVPSTGLLYAADAGGMLMEVDADAGTERMVGPFGVGISITGLAFERSTSRLIGVDEGVAYHISVSSGAATEIGTTGYSVDGLAPGL